MPKTVVRNNEELEDALNRFKRDVNRSGKLKEVRKREHYLKPGVAKRERLKENAKKKKY